MEIEIQQLKKAAKKRYAILVLQSDGNLERRRKAIYEEAMKTWKKGKMLGLKALWEDRVVVEKLADMVIQEAGLYSLTKY